ncbi:hypothetical protein MUB24_18405 [Lederbergia sp. NSJ-179]|uniref:hypothetical protein n=1 Tax=Lederbergia sp. NSJ-179 TaxID=2931402 RepID=UPI001FD3A4C6|nr:hypothetical protein [Lederbergia sp. NSJ-179]MCJ7842814.1 hypothetical protein [Lederbergia sp. NSJ-179]
MKKVVFVIKTGLELLITIENSDLTEREETFLEVLILNIVSPVNAQISGVGMVFNPLPKNKDDVFHCNIFWEKSLDEIEYKEFKNTIDKRVKVALKMAGLSNIDIQYRES